MIRNCYLKSKGTSVVQMICKEELNIISRDYNSESVYEEGNYDRDND